MRRPTGRVRLWRDGLLLCERDNLVVNAGLPAFAYLAAGVTTGQSVSVAGYGSGNTAPSVGDTDLSLAPKYYNAVGAATFPSPGTVQFAFAIAAADYAAYGLNVQEIGLFANTGGVAIPVTAGFSYPAWAASSNQPVGNLVRNSAGQPFRSAAPPSWTASTNELLGNLITDSNGNIQQCTGAGTTGATAPVWPISVSGTVSDGTVTWECTALPGYTPQTAASTPSWNTAAIGALTYDGTVAWAYLAALVVPQPMIAHAVVPSFTFGGSANYSGTWSLTF
jgi:hypothetical protein